MLKNQRKKGTDPMRSQHPNTTHTYLTRVEQICLGLTIAFLVMFLWGHKIDNDKIKFTGLGMGLSVLMIQTDINLNSEEDDEDDD